MGREIRRVPKGWEHPKKRGKGYIPLYDQSYQEALADYQENPEDWGPSPPDEEYYRPDWPDDERTCYQIYETVSEGTPISPVFEAESEIHDWLIAQGYSEKATSEFIKHKWAPSMIMSPETGIVMGIAAMEYM
jgi:hypothetical protein